MPESTEEAVLDGEPPPQEGALAESAQETSQGGAVEEVGAVLSGGLEEEGGVVEEVGHSVQEEAVLTEVELIAKNALRELGKSPDGTSYVYQELRLEGDPSLKRLPRFGTPLLNVTKVVINRTQAEDLKTLGDFRSLTYIDASNNSLQDVLDIEPPLPGLLCADFAHNLINYIKDLSPFRCLRYLNLSFNRISNLSGLENLRWLQTLQIEENRLMSLHGIEGLRSLKSLNASGNAISSLAPLVSLSMIEVLELARNHIQSLEGVPYQTSLISLDLSDNLICDLEELRWLSGLQLLQHLSVKHNPITEMPNIWVHFIYMLPNLVILDGMKVTFQDVLKVSETHEDHRPQIARNRYQCIKEVKVNDLNRKCLPAQLRRYDVQSMDRWDGKFSAIDSQVMNEAEEDNARAGGDDGLVTWLSTIGVKNDMHKVRACYIWVRETCEVIKDDLKSGHIKTVGRSNPFKVEFPTIDVWKERVALLFERVAKACGLKAASIAGYAKGKTFLPGYKSLKPTSWWSAVKADRQWWLLDCSWDEDVDDDCDADDGFCTPPQEFMYHHFPLEKQWQLLKPPYITIDEFLSLPHCLPTYFRLGIQLIDCLTGVIHSPPESAGLHVTMTVPLDVEIKNVITTADWSARLEDWWSLIEREQEFVSNRISFPRQGEYILDVFARKVTPTDHSGVEPQSIENIKPENFLRADSGTKRWQKFWNESGETVMPWRLAVRWKVVTTNICGGQPHPKQHPYFLINNCQLYKPRSGWLVQDTHVRFHLKVPNAKEVILITSKEPTQADSDEDETPASSSHASLLRSHDDPDVYTAEMKTSNSSVLSICMQFNDLAGVYPLLTYLVIPPHWFRPIGK
ncbi:hypothetical protein CBR_g47955 [Chara braunii]|uniref:KY-like immunoglobulin-like domain-containing protein n=1 Tax=Chara braunii TaxID=69332 RepID=A0A388M1V2_CHABU|nr:hypothetical protein CBR_g47955 [Chara braunii]|eukprot:GBG88485.1 hypothetical protein CBR_g47955 [Chara braunii]